MHLSLHILFECVIQLYAQCNGHDTAAEGAIRGPLQDTLLSEMEAQGVEPNAFLWHYIIQQHAWKGGFLTLPAPLPLVLCLIFIPWCIGNLHCPVHRVHRCTGIRQDKIDKLLRYSVVWTQLAFLDVMVIAPGNMHAGTETSMVSISLRIQWCNGIVVHVCVHT